jgi:hypothetical protein
MLLSWARDALGIVVEIVKRTDDVRGFKVLPRRWVVERSFGWLVRNRRPARDYERLTATSEAMIKASMIRLMLVRLAGQSSRWSHESHRETARPREPRPRTPKTSSWRNQPATRQALSRVTSVYETAFLGWHLRGHAFAATGPTT